MQDYVARVFISSAFADMQTERNILARQTFPLIRSRFRGQDVDVVAVDLRWGITDERAAQGQTAQACLREVRRCSPYFIGMLGERYGTSIPTGAASSEAVREFPALVGANGSSMTDIEVVEALSAPKLDRTVILVRDPRWIDTLPARLRIKHMPKSEDETRRLRLLKDRIKGSGVRVVEYSRPEAVGNVLYPILSEMLEQDFGTAPDDAYVLADRLHSAYARTKSTHYVGISSDMYFDALDSLAQHFYSSDHLFMSPPVLFSGAPGRGKSTLIASWLAHRRQIWPREIIIEHYVGASPESALPEDIIYRIWDSLNRHTQDSVPIPHDTARRTAEFSSRLRRADAWADHANKPIIIAIDGLDKLARGTDLTWFPDFSAFKLPQLRFFVSAADGPVTKAAKAGYFNNVRMVPFRERDRAEFVTKLLAHLGRELPKPLLARIGEHPAAESPLFIKTVIEELCATANHDRLAYVLDYYLQSKDLTDLFGRLLGRLEEDHGQKVLRDTMSLLWASERGLLESDIIELAACQPSQWIGLQAGLGDALRYIRGGICLDHQHIRDAAGFRYHLRGMRQRRLRKRLASYFSSQAWNRRTAREQSQQLSDAGQWKSLRARLVDREKNAFDFSETLDLIEYVKQLLSHGSGLDVLVGQFPSDARKWSQSEIRRALRVLRVIKEIQPQAQEAWKLANRIVAAATPLLERDERLTDIQFEDFAAGLDNLLEAQQADKARAFNLLLQRRVVEHLEKIRGEDDEITLAAMHRLGALYHEASDHPAALKLHKHICSIESRKNAPDHRHTLLAQANLAFMIEQCGDRVRASALYDEVLSKMRVHFDDTDHDLLNVATNLSNTIYALGYIVEATRLKEETLSKMLESDHPRAIQVMHEVATLRFRAGEPLSALELMKKVVETYEQEKGADHEDTLRMKAEASAMASASFENALQGVVGTERDR